ncbi:MAG TPA: hypothetical protein VGA02_05235 [Gemmatimonadales bacterium]
MERLPSLVLRGLFLVALVLGGLALWEKAANILGFTLTFVFGLDPSRLLEWAAIVLLFVIVLLLREIKHQTGGARPAGP